MEDLQKYVSIDVHGIICFIARDFVLDKASLIQSCPVF